MNDTTEFCMFNLPVVYVYGSFSFNLDTIYLVLVHINSTSGSRAWEQGCLHTAQGDLLFEIFVKDSYLYSEKSCFTLQA